MRPPSIEEIKEHFKNAKTVQCLSDGERYEIDVSREYNITNYGIYLNTSVNGIYDEVCLWNRKTGFAEILSKKPRPNRLDELEKRVEILEVKQKQETSFELPTLQTKDLIINGVPYDEWLKESGKTIIINSAFDIAPIPDYKKSSPSGTSPLAEALNDSQKLNFGIDFGTDSHLINAFRMGFKRVDTNTFSEINRLKKRNEELEHEIKSILAGGKSKLEKENEFLKKTLDEAVSDCNYMLQILKSSFPKIIYKQITDKLFKNSEMK